MASAKACIARFCKECIYDPTETGSWRQQVENCTITSCPLYSVRPLTTATVHDKRKSRLLSDGKLILVDEVK